jgi:hypothetical protein
MYPKTIYGWYNNIIRGYPYNEKTAYILDHTFKPNSRLISTLEKKKHRKKSSNKISIKRISQK